MTRPIRLRPWQRRALDAFRASPAPDFLTVATPGAGKTTFALAAALTALEGAPGRVVIVAPTQHLKLQWAQAAAGLGLHLDPSWSRRDGGLATDMHGAVVTYQQVAANAEGVAPLARDAFVVFDEVHHAGDDRAWGDGLRVAFSGSRRRLALSGTPFRSDTQAIPFVQYVTDEAEADFEYGYGDALEEGGVVRPVFFPRTDGQMEWMAPDGAVRSHTFADRLDAAASGQRLRTALSLDGQWLPEVIDRAHEQLQTIRKVQPDAGGLVIAMDQEHARGIAAMLRARHGVDPAVATSDDPTASARIARFATGVDPWIVAVRMISEGVDVPRLRVGVYATNTTTELFFRQAVGRLVRWRRGLRRQKAFLFIPDDPKLRTWATQIAEQRRHRLRRRPDEPEGFEDLPARAQGSDEQLSLFAAISATAIGGAQSPELAVDDAPAPEAAAADDPAELLWLAPPPLPGADPDGEGAAASRGEHKAVLRAGNAERARTLARLTGMTHAQVNRELNRLAGLRSIDSATVAQLQDRLRHADRWLRRL